MDSYIFRIGKHSGETFLKVKKKDPTYFIFLITQPIINLKYDYLLYINYNYYHINNYNFTIGKYKGTSFSEVRKKYPNYFIFLSNLDICKLKNEYKLYINYCMYYLTQF
tara:strand:+ start:102 stop:428 length:327 start_codon:yes stop_codon:yes gene_type:complete